MLRPLIWLLALLCPHPLWADGQPWDAQPLDPAALSAAQEASGKALAALPAADKSDAATNGRRAILERRQALLQDLISALQKHTSALARRQHVAAAAASERSTPDPATDADPPAAPPAPDQVTPEGLDALKHRVEAAHAAVNDLNDRLQKTRERLAKVPELLAKARAHADKSDADRTELATESAADGRSSELLQLQRENAAIDSRTARLTVEALEAEQQTLREEGPRLSAQLDRAKSAVTPLEQAFGQYKEVLQQRQQEQTDALAREAERKKVEAERAASPLARFLANAEAVTTGIERDSAALAAKRTRLSKALLELENGLKTDQADLKELQAMLDGGGLSEAAKELLREVYSDIERRRRQLHEAISPETLGWIRRIPSQTIAVQKQLNRLNDEWDRQLAGLPGPQRDSEQFQQRAAALLAQRRKALHDQAALLRSTSLDGHKLEALPGQRLAVLDNLEDFVGTHVLWMQDARPLDHEVLINAGNELYSTSRPNSLRSWWAAADPTRLADKVAEVIGHSYVGLMALLLVVVVPLLLWRFSRGSGNPDRPLLQNLLGTMVFPAYLLLVAALIEPGRERFYSALWTNRLLIFLAVILQIWLLSRVFFRANGVAVRRFGMPQPVAASLHLTLNVWGAAALLLLVPERIFSAPPFDFSGLPRLLYTAMELVVLITLYRLIRPRSALMQALLRPDSGPLAAPDQPSARNQRRRQTQRFLGRHWPAISAIITAALIGILVLDLLGFRYTAARLSASAIASLAIIGVLLALYWVLVATMDRFMWQRLTAADAPSATVETDPQRLRRQVKRGLRAILVLFGTLMIILAWSNSAGDTLPLHRFKLYSVVAGDGTRVFVTLGNLVDFAVILVLLVWLLRELKTIFELLIFPHLSLDRGKRYATVTIARYLVFGLGILIALDILRVDLSNVGWLIAAMGVGLGFGLQEIFANFVSGLILLVERPIRVGDLVTIGNVMGTISHISFRATTVVAFNNEEILVPNRELITSQVTNWTLGSEVTRIIVPIQVAYGSDVDRVSDLLLDIAQQDSEVLKDPAPAALFMAHGESGLDFELRVHLGKTSQRLSTLDRLNRNINRRFAEQHIEIPFPQRDVHIRGLDWPSPERPVRPQRDGRAGDTPPAHPPHGEPAHG